MAHTEQLTEQLKQYYGILVTDIHPAPRGFAAETFYVDTHEKSYFLKIMHNPRRQEIFKHGLHVTDALVQMGITFIPPMLRALDGQLYFAHGESVAALYERVDAQLTYSYDRRTVFRQLAEIYRVSERLPDRERFWQAEFSEWFVEAYEQERAVFLQRYTETEEARQIQDILAPYEDFLSSAAAEARKVIAVSQAEQSKFYLTHSDYTSNVLISDSGDYYLIDFDEAMFGPIERDGFLSLAPGNEESEWWIEVIRECFPDYEPNRTYILYYLYERLLIDLASFMRESVEHTDDAHRQRLVTTTRDYLMGWLYPMILRNQ